MGVAGPDDEPFLVPMSSQHGMLRFVYVDEGRAVPSRVLQQYQWSAHDGDFGWYDIPLVDE
jgi:hypothetical protein